MRRQSYTAGENIFSVYVQLAKFWHWFWTLDPFFSSPSLSFYFVCITFLFPIFLLLYVCHNPTEGNVGFSWKIVLFPLQRTPFCFFCKICFRIFRQGYIVPPPRSVGKVIGRSTKDRKKDYRTKDRTKDLTKVAR